MNELPPLRCLSEHWTFPRAGLRRSFDAMPPPPGIDRMWVSMLLMTMVTVTPDRLVMSVWFPSLTEAELELHRSKIAAAFQVDEDRPNWMWQRGTNLLPIMRAAGHPWVGPVLENGIEEVWGWHYAEPNSPMADPERVRQMVQDRVAGFSDGERN